MTCSYCYMRNESPSWGKFASKRQIFEVLEQLERIDNKISVCLSGGECSLHPNFMDVVKYVANSSNIYELHINTNLQLSQESIDNVLRVDPNVKFHISWHVEAQSDFIDKIRSIPSQNRELNIMIHPAKKYKRELTSIINRCVKYDILFNIKPVFINSTFKPTEHTINTLNIPQAHKEYTDGVRDYSDYDLYSNNMLPMQTKGWDCYYIFYTIDCRNGNIKQMCILQDDLNIFKDYKFFNDYDLSKPITCPFDNGCLWPSALDHYKESK